MKKTDQEIGNQGTIKVLLTLSVHTVGPTPAWQIVPIIIDKLLYELGAAKSLQDWNCEIGKVEYEPLKPGAGGKAFSLKLDQRKVELGKA